MTAFARALSGWFLNQQKLTRYFIVALIAHAALVFVLTYIHFRPPADDHVSFPPNPLSGSLTTVGTGETVVPRPETAASGGGSGGSSLAKTPTSQLTPSTQLVSLKPIAPDLPSGGPSVVTADGAGSIRPEVAFGVGEPGYQAIPTYIMPAGYGNRGKFPGPGGDGTTGGTIEPAGQPLNPAIRNSIWAAMRWLKQQQRSDGSWECGPSTPAGSALAMLVFFGYGQGTDSVEFGATVNRGLEYLLDAVDENGLVKDGNMYAQGIVTLALAEGYVFSGRSPAVRGALDRAVGLILRSQKASKRAPEYRGGWRYSVGASDADVSVSGWMIMALCSAKHVGVEIPDEALQSAGGYLWQAHGKPGFGYQRPDTTPTMTGVAVLCLQFMGQDEDKRLIPALDYLNKQKIHWDRSTGEYLLYSWYYGTLAMYHAGGTYWKAWSDQMIPALLQNQQHDGHWPLPAGSGEGKRLAQSPVYATALAALTLEVQARYRSLHELAKNK